MTNAGPQIDESRRVEDALLVSDRVEIREVSLASAKLSRTVARDGVTYSVDIQRATRASIDQTTGALRVRADMGFVAREQGGTDAAQGAIEVRATYELTYDVSDRAGLEQTHFDAFAEFNGVFNAWPYFREFLQSSLVRMGLNPYTLPVMRLPREDAIRGVGTPSRSQKS